MTHVQVGPALPAAPSLDLELRHGYTLHDVERLATSAVTRHHYHRWMPHPEKLDVAYGAIVERLYAEDDPPTGHDLVRAAWLAMTHAGHDEWTTHGVTDDGEVMARRNYWRYWWTQIRATPSPEDHIVERIALRQIFDQLTPVQRQVILAKAAHQDSAQAAVAMDRNLNSYRADLYQARRRFLVLWLEGERPVRVWSSRHLKPERTKRRSKRPAGLDCGRVVDAWLASYDSRHTHDAYSRGIDLWLDWCSSHGVGIMTARPEDVDAYRAELDGADPPLAPTTIRQRLAAVAAFYSWAHERAGETT
jgi:hypothetical protein